VLVAEDARPTEGPDLALLIGATEHHEPLVRGAAVRALGRLETPEHRDAILSRLADPAASVRAFAAMALAESARGDDGEAVLAPLLERTQRENDPAARGALARALGRLRLAAGDREQALEAIFGLGRRLAPGEGGDAPSETLLGVALGLEALIAGADGEGIGLGAAERLRELLLHRRDAPADVGAGQVRALALASLAAARRLSLELALLGLDDPDAEVRRTAVRHMDAVVPSRRHALLRVALADPSERVAIEAIRFIAARARTEESCVLLVGAARGLGPRPAGDVATRVEALAALRTPCPGPEQGDVLREVAAALDGAPAGTPAGTPADQASAWHAPAQALRSLQRIDPSAAARLLPRYVGHPDPFVRAHAADVAATLRDRQTLGTLSVDESPNVRTAAVTGLCELQGHAIDPLLRAHLESDDPGLLLTVAGLLAGSQQTSENAEAALAAFERVSEARRETLRDPRRALLERVAELGVPPSGPTAGEAARPADVPVGFVDRLRPYLSDYDPVVAADVAAILERWTGELQQATPRAPRRAPLPSVEELAALERTTVTLHVRGVGAIVVRPLPHTAITNAHRFVSLATRGYYDGLSFHRRVPNFVLQGGSPGANEYAGDGPFTRDEIGLPHWRGTVGLSTRGRDTGDAQIFINLVHNTRLDPDYTVFGVVTQGMDVVDRVLEGAVIERAEVRVED
jgi:cyclophilin family peptidyl-prolyl cis-trans isomerase/HEAT repeat protein